MKPNKEMTATEVIARYKAGFLNFDGQTYDKARDKVRLGTQLAEVLNGLTVNRGIWMTLERLSRLTSAPEASVSARIRDLRKAKFGGHEIERRYVRRGLWEYRMVK
jgi:hypothetical protein